MGRKSRGKTQSTDLLWNTLRCSVLSDPQVWPYPYPDFFWRYTFHSLHPYNIPMLLCVHGYVQHSPSDTCYSFSGTQRYLTLPHLSLEQWKTESYYYRPFLPQQESWFFCLQTTIERWIPKGMILLRAIAQNKVQVATSIRSLNLTKGSIFIFLPRNIP